MKKTDLTEYYESEFTKEGLTQFIIDVNGHETIIDYPIIYLLMNRNSIYIGETANIVERMDSHLKDGEKKLFKNCHFIYHPLFNKSATYNIETNLIRYAFADNNLLTPTNKSQTKIEITHNYYDRKFFNEDLFEEIWEHYIDEGIFKENINIIKDKDIFKISPYTDLNYEQYEVREKILQFSKRNIENDNGAMLLIHGEAGTGKSVLLSSTLKRLLDEAKEPSSLLNGKTNIYLLVHHEEMIKTYKEIARRIPGLEVKRFLKPTTFINKIDKGELKVDDNNQVDIVLIDEAHLLLSKSDSYNNFKYDNHLEEIIKRSKVTIAIFDDKQVLKAKSYWNRNSIDEFVGDIDFEEHTLESQMRMEANSLSQRWINNIVNKEIGPIPDDRKFEIKIFDDAKEMHNEIVKKNESVGLSRLVSTFDYIHKKDGGQYFITEGELHLPWNGKYKKTWAENPETLNEVGSIYTIQGFDLNYVGVILGPSVQLDSRSHRIVIDHSKYKDTEAFKGIENVKDSKGNSIDSNKIKEEIILNSINILLKRGVKGLYIYASNPELRSYLIKQNIKG